MKIVAIKERHPGESRVPLIPASVAKLVKLGAEVVIETGLGEGSYFSDAEYEKAGAKIGRDAKSLYAEGDLIVRLRKPPKDDVSLIRPDAVLVSYLSPFDEKNLVQSLADRGVSSICLEMVPRSTIAQKMDVLSSQASLAGYVAVLLAADHLPKVFPMMTTPAGTIQPARVFIIGAGVAGLQAIATAKRLGARVEAFDTRAEVAEQIQSLGAKFIKIDLGETGSTKDGYAKALTPEQLEIQRQGMAKVCTQSDVVITTAQVFGRRAPRILTKDMISGMVPGSVVVDLAVETGGNVEGSVAGQVVEVNGVKIVGVENLPGRVAAHASQMFSSNVTNMIEHFWDKEQKRFQLKLEDPILKGCLVTHQKQITSEMLRNHYAGANA